VNCKDSAQIQRSSWVDGERLSPNRGRLELAVNLVLSLVTQSPGQGWSALRIKPSLQERVGRVRSSRREVVSVALGDWAVFQYMRVTTEGLTDDRRRPRRVIRWRELDLGRRAQPGSAAPGGPDTRVVEARFGGKTCKLYADLQDLALIHVMAGREFEESEWAPPSTSRS
jgi:hypothetical protein